MVIMNITLFILLCLHMCNNNIELSFTTTEIAPRSNVRFGLGNVFRSDTKLEA